MLDSIRGGLAPGKGGVSGDKNAGDGQGGEVLLAEAADDDRACIAHVSLGDFLGG